MDGLLDPIRMHNVAKMHPKRDFGQGYSMMFAGSSDTITGRLWTPEDLGRFSEG
jgi:hypothetical protein